MNNAVAANISIMRLPIGIESRGEDLAPLIAMGCRIPTPSPWRRGHCKLLITFYTFYAIYYYAHYEIAWFMSGVCPSMSLPPEFSYPLLKLFPSAINQGFSPICCALFFGRAAVKQSPRTFEYVETLWHSFSKRINCFWRKKALPRGGNTFKVVG